MIFIPINPCFLIENCNCKLLLLCNYTEDSPNEENSKLFSGEIEWEKWSPLEIKKTVSSVSQQLMRIRTSSTSSQMCSW